MKRLLGILLASLFALGLIVPGALAADEPGSDDRVLVSVNGDASVPAGEQADVLVVVRGNATVSGEVTTLVVVDGNAILDAATVESLFIVRGRASLDADTTVLGDVRTLDATVDRDPGADVRGEVRGLESDLVGLGFVLGPAMIVMYLGFAVAMVLAGLAVAAFAARQVREAGSLISREPLLTFLVGILGVIVPPILAVLAAITIIGIPAAIALLVVVWPAIAFIGYLVVAIWVGDWIVTRLRGAPERERPYLAAVIGVIVLQIGSIIPPVAAIVSLFGLGAVILLGWRVARGRGEVTAGISAAAPA